MSGDVTLQALSRLSYLPGRDDGDNGNMMAGQEYDNVYIAGGTLINVDVTASSLTLTSALPIGSGGTGATTASAARTALGVAIGSDVQAYSANLDTFSGLTLSTSTTLTGASNTEVASSLAIKTYVDTEVAAAGVSDGDKGDITVSGSGATWTIDNDVVNYAKIQNVSATDRILGRSTAGAGDIEEITCTAAGRALLDDADAAAQRATMGLGTLATKNGVDNDEWNVGGEDLAIINGGTGASTASVAFSNLKQAATTSSTGVVELATDAELGTEAAGKIPDCSQLKESPTTAIAWGVFNGTLTGTNAALAGYNIGDVVRNSTGDYSITFTNDASSANYAVVTASSRDNDGTDLGRCLCEPSNLAAGGFDLNTGVFSSGFVAEDHARVHFVVYGVLA